MSFLLLTYIMVFCVVHYALAIFLKRNKKIRYDKKTLIATALFGLIGFVYYFFLHLEFHPVDSPESEKILWLILIFFGSYAVIQFVFWMLYAILRHYNLTRLPRFTFNIFAWAIIILIVVMSSKVMFNTNLTGFLVTSTVISAIVGLSVQDTLTNLFAGISLQSEAPFTIGDWVYLGGQEGKVVDQNWRSLTLLSRANHRITLPNKMIAQEKIINYSKPTQRQIHIFDVGLDYSHPPNEVKAILNKVLDDMPEVEIDHIAFPFVKEYADSSITYSLKFWIEDYGQLPFIQDKILSRLWYALRRKNIKIPFPISELHLQMMEKPDREKEHIYDKEKVHDELKDFSWLEKLSDAQLDLLAEKAWIETYAKEEYLILEGEEGDSMFIIVKGIVDILIKNPEGLNVQIAEKKRGEFFGEMSLLTGKERSATIRAREDTTVVVIDKKAFSEILLKDEQLLELFIASLESNQSSLAKVIDDFSKQGNVKESGRAVLIRRIKTYLNLSNDIG